MKVIFKTNIDHYNDVQSFPKSFDACPLEGHRVHVRQEVRQYFIDKKLPTFLNVVAVEWKEDPNTSCGKYRTVAIVELHYDALSIKAAELSGVKLF